MTLTLAITGCILTGAAVTIVGVYAAHLADIRTCLLASAVVASVSASIGVTVLPRYGVYATILTVCVTAGMLAHHHLADRDSPLAEAGDGQ